MAFRLGQFIQENSIENCIRLPFIGKGIKLLLFKLIFTKIDITIMKKKSLFRLFVLLILSIGLISCSKDEEVIDDDNTGERTFAEICKDVSDIDYAIVDYYEKSESLAELIEHIDEISKIKGVEEVFYDNNSSMYVRIKDFGTISYSFYQPAEYDITPLLQKSKSRRIKYGSNSSIDPTYTYQNLDNTSVIIVNQQSKNEDKQCSWAECAELVRGMFVDAGFDEPTIENSPNVEFFKNGLFEHDYVFLMTHGQYEYNKKSKQGIHWLLTSVEVPCNALGNVNSEKLAELLINYNTQQDVSYGRVKEIRKGKKETICYLKVSEHFISETSKQFKHPGKGIVFNSACHSMQGSNEPDSISYSLSDVFINRGAGAYFGYDEEVSVSSLGGVNFWGNLLSGMSIENAIENMDFVLRHEYRTDKLLSLTVKSWWADLIPHMSKEFGQSCISRPLLDFEDKSNDDGLKVILSAVEPIFYIEFDKQQMNNVESLRKMPLRYGFELSESDLFLDVVTVSKNSVGDDGCSLSSSNEYILFSQSLTYNATESNSMIKPETTYWARAFVYDGSGYNYSEPLTFTTGKYERIDQVVPSDIREQMEPYIDIYDGNNPPNIEGEYIASPWELVYSSHGYSPGDIFADRYFKFYNQNLHNNTLDYKGKQASSEDTGTGAFISGEGNNFSVFFNTEGVTHYSEYDINTKTALIVSGTLAEGGISNLQYAFVMVDKSDDPNHHVIDVGVFRVFHDQDGFSPVSNWYSAKRRVDGYNPNLPSYLDYDR